MNGSSQLRQRPLLIGPLLVTVVLLGACANAAGAEGAAGESALVVGIAVWPGHDLTKAQVQLYRDPQCTKLAFASRTVGREGTYAIVVPQPGIYYARLLVDANGNGASDAGDGVGFHGLRRPENLGQAPRAIELKAGGIVVDVIIPVIATIGANGALQPLAQGAAPLEAPPMILGAVVWPGHDLRDARVRLFSDERLSTVACESPPVEEGGSFAIVADPGTYYACVTVDVDGDGKFGPGDAVGYYGVTDMTDASQRPLPIALGPGHATPHLVIAVSAVLTQERKLQAVEVPEEVKRAAAGSGPLAQTAGTVLWPGHTFERAWVVAASSPDLREVLAVARPEVQSGRYTLSAPAVVHVLVALVDANANERFDAGDCVGFRGSEATAADAEIRVVARLTEDGSLAPLVGEPSGASALKLNLAEVPALVSGRLVWEGKSPKQGSITFFQNRELTQVAAVVLLGADGAYAAALAPGAYYLMGGADMDGDGSMSPGDGLGLYGAGRMGAPEARQPVTVGAGALRAGLDVRITDVVGDDGRLRAAGP